ncbi:unnamed protein product [Discula destructiva]
MAAMASAQTATITPPSSSHGHADGFQWDFATAPANAELQNYHRPYDSKSSLPKNDVAANGASRAALSAQNGNVAVSAPNSVPVNVSGGDALERDYRNEHDTPDSMADDSLDNDDDRQGRIGVDGRKRAKGQEWSDEDSKWIHRDKLAKIESDELQAAGFIVPAPRSRSRSRAERSQSRNRSAADSTRKRQDSSMEPQTPETTAAIKGWANEADDDLLARPTTGSRIPVPKKISALPRTRENSPEELEKRNDSSKARSRSNSTILKTLEPSPNLKPQSVKRVGTDATPKKSTTPSGARKTSAPAKTIPPEARGKPKPKNKSTTNGSGSGSGSGGRPSTRDGLRDSSTGSLGSKQMEGDPPWMINAYKPDPRLPPDQQLLPTVARRLAQEKWEQEGKFGNIYDKDFRPLTDEGYLPPPTGAEPSSGERIMLQEIETKDGWPLKSAEPKSPASLGRSSTYSTMPKIQDKLPSHQSPVPSPRLPQNPMPPAPQPMQVTRVPDVAEKQPQSKATKSKEGCGCCIVM